MRPALVGLTATAVAVTVWAGPGPAAALGVSQATAVSDTPAAYTPDVTDGVVYAIGQAGSTVVLGGSFTSISPHGTAKDVAAPGLAAFTAGTGELVSTFKPTLNGIVESVAAGPTSGTIYVGGDFTTIDGMHSTVALLSTKTGRVAQGWRSPAVDGPVKTIVASHGLLYVGGYFTSVGTASRVGLAVLNGKTGAVEKVATAPFTGHHNYGVHCDPTTTTCAKALTGIKYLDINPAGTLLVADGNFTSVAGRPRDQLALLRISKTAVTLDTSWATDAYTSGCNAPAFDTYIRDVQFSPTGSYFVVTSTGADVFATNSDGTVNTCDAVARFSASGSGADVRPTWIDYTGNDTLLSVAVTGTAVYVGGHQRWLNNSYGNDSAQQGAVPRPGVAALDPVNGLPLSWNPGRSPRGAGAYSLLATKTGLYVGSDTDYIGNRRYLHRKLAFFPLAGGRKLATNSTGSLPGRVYLLGGGSGAARARQVGWSGTSEKVTADTLTAVDWSGARGAFEVNGFLYYGDTDGSFYRRSVRGRTFGAAVAIDPYDDPAWDSVQTGSGQTYQGQKASFYGELSSVTSMFYSAGRVYYTLAGEPKLFWRWFEPESGIIGAEQFTTTVTFDASQVKGAFLSTSTLYYATAAGVLMKVGFSGGRTTGTPTVANSTLNWASAGAFVLSDVAKPGH